MHYYQFNIADYRKDTNHLSPIEHYIYRSLIDWYYLDEKPIPLETQVVIRRLCLGSEMVIFLSNVLADFFQKDDKGYNHKRIDSEIVCYHDMADKNRTNGKLGGRPRKTQVVATGNPSESQNNLNHKPLTINHKPINNISRTSALDDGFDEFWNNYPKKTGKDKALIAWKKKKPKLDVVLKSLVWQKESEQWNKQSGQFIPNPTTYINEGRWKDEPAADRSPF